MQQRKLKTALEIDPPLTDDEENRLNVNRLLRNERNKLTRARAIVIEECKRNSRFLDKLLADIKPLRGRGWTKPPPWRNAMVAATIRTLHGHAVKDICKTIELSCRISESTARRLYDEYRRASHKSAFVRKTKR